MTSTWITTVLSTGILVYLGVMLFREGRRTQQMGPEQDVPPPFQGAVRCPTCGAWLHRFAPLCGSCNQVLRPILMVAPGLALIGYQLRHALWGAPREIYILAAGLALFGWVVLRYGSRPPRLR